MLKLSAIDILLTKRTNTIAANETKNLHSEKVSYHCAKQKDNGALTKNWKQ